MDPVIFFELKWCDWEEGEVADPRTAWWKCGAVPFERAKTSWRAPT